ncbi:hypothetical protein VDG07_17390 [Xanthomonas campestris pv. raphani]|uniref:hypothetical protein n=1 Tax=Xanthomonas campestris TaxID=339 RepID=UPI002B23AE25|nr:hypothetical protein [Xanthomonas campestris]MEA9797077.1 hypothetical protein [Xanthomonas campestris pv. raphani]
MAQVLLEFGKEVFDQVPAQAELLLRARKITRGTGERDRQPRSFAHKPMLEAQLLINELGAQEARVCALEASLGLKPSLFFQTTQTRIKPIKTGSNPIELA